MVAKMKTKIGVVGLAFLIMFSSLTSPAYANDDSLYKIQENNYTVRALSDDTVVVNSENGVEYITVKEDDKTRKVTIYNQLNGKEEYFILNKTDGSIYSSITNKTVNRDNQANTITPRAATSYSTVYISWAEMRDILGSYATVGGLVGMVLSKIPGGVILGGPMSTLSTIVGVGALFLPKDSEHGLKFKVKTRKYYRKRLGKRRVWKTDKSIVSVSRY